MLVACRKAAIFCAFQASTNQTWNVRHTFHRRSRSALHVLRVLASFCRLASNEEKAGNRGEEGSCCESGETSEDD